MQGRGRFCAVEEYLLIGNFFSQEDFDETVALTNELLELYKIPSCDDYEM